MVEYTVIDNYGNPLRWGTCPQDLRELQAGPGQAVVGSLPPSEHHYWTGVQWVPRPDQPSPEHRWDMAQKVWVDPRTLAQAQQARVARLRLAREAFEQGGFVWDGSVFDSDDKAQMRILGLVKDAEDPAFPGRQWRLADNSWRALSAADVQGVWAALRNHIASAFEQFALLEAQVNAATTVAEVDAITWENPQ